MSNEKETLYTYYFFISSVLNALTLNPGDSYFSIETWGWFGEDKIVGELRVQLVINNIYDNLIEITIIKHMPPFQEILILTTNAKYEENKYKFRCLDGWGNTAYGYFTIEKENIILFLDCEFDTSIYGGIGRLYGDTHVLKKGKIDIFK